MSLLMFMVKDKDTPKLGRLRGRQVFETMEKALNSFVFSAPDANGTMMFGYGTVFADGGNLSVIPFVEEAKARGGCVVVDVHFPVFDIESILSFQPDATGDDRDLKADEEVRKYWSDPDHRQQFFDLIEMADAVTCPRPEWAKELTTFNSNVYILPDVEDVDSGARFLHVWLQICRDISPRRTWFFGIRRWMTKRLLRPILADRLTKDALDEQA